jgi:drug/metabolite transporter (DMT)-like permease
LGVEMERESYLLVQRAMSSETDTASPLLSAHPGGAGPAKDRIQRREAKVTLLWVVIALIAVQASFGGNAVVIKLAMNKNADPVVFSFLRDVGGAAVLLAACKIRGCLVWPRREDWGTFILLGVLGVYIGMQFQTLALQYIEPLNAAVLQPSQPVLTTLLAAVFGIEPLHLDALHGRLKLAGVLMACLGAVLTIYWDSRASDGSGGGGGGGGDGTPPSSENLLLGNLLLLIQCISGALYQLLQKHLLSQAEYPPLAVAAMGYLVGAIAIGLVLPVCKANAEAWAFVSDATVAGALAYAILMTSAFNYALCAFANKYSSPTLVTAFFPLQVVFTALFAWMAFGKPPLPTDYIGAAMIFSGLSAVTLGRLLAAREQASVGERRDALLLEDP